MKYTLHHYSGRGLAEALHRSNNKTCTIQFPLSARFECLSLGPCVCVCGVRQVPSRCGFQGCLSAESLDDLIWVDQMNHTFPSAAGHTSPRHPPTQNPPRRLPRKPLCPSLGASAKKKKKKEPTGTPRLADSCGQMNQLTSDTSA